MPLSNSSLISILFESTLHGQRIEAPRQAVHHIADLSEHPYATGPALNMLTQPTERYKLGPAIHLWAPVYLVLVARALQVLVEPCESGERRVTQEALIYSCAVPLNDSSVAHVAVGAGGLERPSDPGSKRAGLVM